MKLSWSFFFSSLYCSASASKVGRVYVHDAAPTSPLDGSPSVSPETARLILAQRLGVSRFHSIKHHEDERSIEQISLFGGRQQKLFGGEKRSSSKAHVLIWVDDVEDPTDIIKDGSMWQASFSITNPPSASDNDRLIQDIILQAESLPKYADPLSHTYLGSIHTHDVLASLKETNVYNDYLTVFRADKSDKLSLAELSKQIASLQATSSDASGKGPTYAVTVVLMPPSTSHSKRSVQPWGTYDVPSNFQGRRQKTEALLSSTPEPSKSPNPNLEDFPAVTLAQDDSPVLGILKSCFDTESACAKQTHNCSSHGECRRLSKAKKGDNGQVKDCWGCSCKPTVVHVGEDHGMESKKKTTYWGGPACQKKDVSVPFWLFVGSGVTLAFLIASGIGLLYSMGSEQLPSVIGAGVSGPQRK